MDPIAFLLSPEDKSLRPSLGQWLEALATTAVGIGLIWGVVRFLTWWPDLAAWVAMAGLIFAGHFLKKPVAYWLGELEKAGVPSGPINDFSQVFSDPHVQSRGMRVKVNHPFEPELSLIRNAITFSGTPVKDYRAPPLLGADTKDVLATIGYDDAKLEQLKAQKIV